MSGHERPPPRPSRSRPPPKRPPARRARRCACRVCRRLPSATEPTSPSEVFPRRSELRADTKREDHLARVATRAGTVLVAVAEQEPVQAQLRLPGSQTRGHTRDRAGSHGADVEEAEELVIAG